MGNKNSYYEVIIEYDSGGKISLGPFWKKADALDLICGPTFAKEAAYMSGFWIQRNKDPPNYFVISNTIWPQIIGKYFSYSEASYMKQKIKENVGDAHIIETRKRKKPIIKN